MEEEKLAMKRRHLYNEKQKLNNSINTRLETLRQQKADEVRLIKNTIDNSLAMAAELSNAELEAKRELASVPTVILDDASSSVISIPDHMQNRVKGAKT